MMRMIDADALNDVMYHEAFENDESYNEKNPIYNSPMGRLAKRIAERSRR